MWFPTPPDWKASCPIRSRSRRCTGKWSLHRRTGSWRPLPPGRLTFSYPRRWSRWGSMCRMLRWWWWRMRSGSVLRSCTSCVGVWAVAIRSPIVFSWASRRNRRPWRGLRSWTNPMTASILPARTWSCGGRGICLASARAARLNLCWVIFSRTLQSFSGPATGRTGSFTRTHLSPRRSTRRWGSI